ncbi:conserved hypothetical protein [Roseibium sp. TrichSKD4]|uniref:hypothetical protein n=1 Tax=Roseibium sp. TrichSKD4 TaxID=744980 RepID=UPI0001E5761A|nr:hypothetical protein [Roseibium sp. TrichSKD4]EFO30961.1 conserved hypothetical protein [Roseibium sp. TrichSKD4]
MTSTGYWTRRELAMLLGFDRMGETAQEIALEMGRQPLEVAQGIEKAHALINEPKEAPKAEKRPPLRRFGKPVQMPIDPAEQQREEAMSESARLKDLQLTRRILRDVTGKDYGDTAAIRAAKQTTTDNSGDRA